MKERKEKEMNGKNGKNGMKCAMCNSVELCIGELCVDCFSLEYSEKEWNNAVVLMIDVMNEWDEMGMNEDEWEVLKKNGMERMNMMDEWGMDEDEWEMGYERNREVKVERVISGMDDVMDGLIDWLEEEYGMDCDVLMYEDEWIDFGFEKIIEKEWDWNGGKW